MLWIKHKKKIPVSPDKALIIRVREYISKNYQPQKKDIPWASISYQVQLPKQRHQESRCLGKTYEPDICHDSTRSMAVVSEQSCRSLEELIQNMGETFQTRLLRLIDERGWTDAQAYKKAGKDKKLFHKIRSNPAYQPSRHTVFAFALGLELSVDETVDLLASAGFAFSPCSRFDLIVKYALEHNIYDLYTVDCILYELGEEAYFCCQK